MSGVVVDASAIVGILLEEPEAGRLARALAGAEARLMSSGTMVETCVVMVRKHGEGGLAAARRLLDGIALDVVPVGPEHTERAVDAAVRFGRGRHPGGLNFGDCFTYALASVEGLPILCLGNDFRQTDVEVVDLDA